MSFSMADYLQDYRKEDISKEKEIIRTKWRKTLDVITEAFSDKYVNAVEAKRIIKNEFAKEDCPSSLDKKFIVENLDYILDKVENLSEGDIRIIINNGSKEPKAKVSDIEEIDEAKGKKGKKKGKKDDEDKDDKDSEADEEEVIIDEPTEVDAIKVDTEAPETAEVTITYNKDEKTLVVKEGDDVMEDFEVEDPSTLKQVVEFLKDFYSKHEYIINEEGLEDIEEVEGEEKEIENKEEVEGGEKEEVEDNGTDESIAGEEVEEVLPENKRYTFLDLLQEEVEVINEEDKPKGCDLVGKAIEIKGQWFTVQECDDSNMLKVLDKDGQSSVVDYKDITDWEKSVAVTEGKMSWLKKAKVATGKSSALKSAIDKKKDVKVQGLSRKPMSKTGQKIPSVKVPKIEKRGESNKAYSKTPMKTTGQKVPSIAKVPTMKKDSPTGSFSKSPMKKISQKIPSVKVPSVAKKDAPTGSYSKKPAKPQEKHEKVKAPKI